MAIHHITFMNEAVKAGEDSYGNSYTGACIVDENHKIVGKGRAQMPNNSGLHIQDDTERKPYVCHAELNAILNAFTMQRKLDNCTLYVTRYPCENCGKLIIRSGIRKVFYREHYIPEEEFQHFEGIVQIEQC